MFSSNNLQSHLFTSFNQNILHLHSSKHSALSSCLLIFMRFLLSFLLLYLFPFLYQYLQFTCIHFYSQCANILVIIGNIAFSKKKMRSCFIVDMFRLINSTICKYPIVMIRPTKGATIKTWISGKNPTIYMHSFLLTMCKHICHNSKHYIFQKMSNCFIVDMFGLINRTICKNIYRMVVRIRTTIMGTANKK